MDATDLNVENEIAAVIRLHRNGTDPDFLAARIARKLADLDGVCQGDDECECWTERAEQIADIIRRVNPNHTMGAGNLAEHIYTDLYGIEVRD